ncbi:hypothetical protein V6N11_080177 [Hibiscus sabdariffa]|uniref:Uncharacterized protein n=1 Tax=Hibiscus sabdariffa TaxID=183260 RepID=A0ABR1ZWT2_9ROSI
MGIPNYLSSAMSSLNSPFTGPGRQRRKVWPQSSL